jgi:hypothetical protein
MSDPVKDVDAAAQSVVNAEIRATNTIKDNARLVVMVVAGVAALALIFILFRVF